MNAPFLLLALNAAPVAQELQVLGCAEEFASQLKVDWAIEGADIGNEGALRVTCLADGKVLLEIPSLRIRRTVAPSQDEHVSQARMVAVIAAELLSEKARRRPSASPDESQAKSTAEVRTTVAASGPQPKQPDNSVQYEAAAAGSFSVKNSLEELPRGLFIGLKRSSSSSSPTRKYVATLETSYESTAVSRVLGTIDTRVVAAAALLGVESHGPDFRAAALAGVKAGRASVQGTPTSNNDYGDHFAAAVASPMARFVLSVPLNRLAVFTSVDAGYALMSVRAHVVNDDDAALTGVWLNVGLGILLSLN